MQLNDMLAPDPILLPADEAGDLNFASPEQALAHPASPMAWALLAEDALATALTPAQVAAAYAFARTGYHRSLDRLRGNGWKGFGPVPWSHEPNQGVLRAIAALAKASKAIGDEGEYDRCRAMLSDADPASVAQLLG